MVKQRSLMECERIREKMDKQFEDDLRARKSINICEKNANDCFRKLVLVQKDMRSYSGIIHDLSSQARRSYSIIEAILQRDDMRKIQE